MRRGWDERRGVGDGRREWGGGGGLEERRGIVGEGE